MQDNEWLTNSVSFTLFPLTYSHGIVKLNEMIRKIDTGKLTWTKTIKTYSSHKRWLWEWIERKMETALISWIANYNF